MVTRRVTRIVTRDHWKVILPHKMGTHDSRTVQTMVTRASYSARVTLFFLYSVYGYFMVTENGNSYDTSRATLCELLQIHWSPL